MEKNANQAVMLSFGVNNSGIQDYELVTICLKIKRLWGILRAHGRGFNFALIMLSSLFRDNKK